MTGPTDSYHGNPDELPPEPADLPLIDPFPDEFRLERRLGKGGFGEVWLAHDLSPLKRLVALKFVKLQPTSEKARRALEALYNEAGLLASVRHPNIVTVYAWKQARQPDVPCLVLQFVAGGSLHDQVKKFGPLPWRRAVRYVADIGDGLLQLHTLGIIHRDVKPENMLLDTALDEALLTDLGIAARLADAPSIAGTFPYMAPEAFRGFLTPSLDVYSLAASLFWLTTGDYPFSSQGPRELSPTDPRLRVLPGEIEQLVRVGLASDFEQRPSLDTFVRELRAGLNRLLADALPGRGPAHLQLLVSRRTSAGNVRLAQSEPTTRVTRHSEVPPAPPRLTLHTGERIVVEVLTDQTGHVTVFNIGPTGNLNPLYPAYLGQTAPELPAGRLLHICDVELKPPTGRERLFALWTRSPLPLSGDAFPTEAAGRGVTQDSAAYGASRVISRFEQQLRRLPPEDWQAVVLEIDHRGACP